MADEIEALLDKTKIAAKTKIAIMDKVKSLNGALQSYQILQSSPHIVGAALLDHNADH